ncbi:MAG: hypothetical protein R3258_08025 [Acidimicrobiia bacterium]|nr:hypothetical protein [Acidimicrobiia bacterium]
MSVYTARLYLPDQTKLPLNVQVDVTDELLVLKSGDQEVADWPIESLAVVKRSDGFHITVDGEEMLLDVGDPGRFALEMGVFEEDLRGSNGSSASSMSPKARAVANARYEDMKLRISELAETLRASDVEPSAVFAKWLRLLKELNLRHGQGSLASDHFYELNTELLELLPEPATAGRR